MHIRFLFIYKHITFMWHEENMTYKEYIVNDLVSKGEK